MDIPALLRQARQAAGLSQVELAKRARTSQPAIARYESGQVSPSVRTLERVLYVLGQRLRVTVEPVGSPVGGPRMRRLHEARVPIEQATHRIGASNVRVFGSVARGEDRPDSDVDLLVDFDVNTYGALPLIRLRRELDAMLGERVDLVTPQLLLPEVAESALAEAVPL